MNLASQSDQEILAIAIMDNFMEGSTEIAHAMHTRDFSERLREPSQGTVATDLQAFQS